MIEEKEELKIVALSTIGIYQRGIEGTGTIKIDKGTSRKGAFIKVSFFKILSDLKGDTYQK